MPVCLKNQHFLTPTSRNLIEDNSLSPNIFFSGIYLWQFTPSGRLKNKLYNLNWKYGDIVWGFTDGEIEKVLYMKNEMTISFK